MSPDETIEEIERDLRLLAVGIGLTKGSDALVLGSLPVTRAVIARDSIETYAAVSAVVRAAATRLPGAAGRSTIRRRDIALAALAFGEYAGTSGLMSRLDGLADGSRTSGTIRNDWYAIAKELAQILVVLPVDAVPEGDVLVLGGVWPYVTSSVHVLYVMDGQRIVRATVSRELRATRAPLRTFQFPFSYPMDIRDGVIQVNSLFNCSVKKSELGGLGHQITTLRLPNTPRGRTVRFGYEIVIDSTKNDLPYIRHLAKVPGGSFTFDIQFTGDVRPSSIWHFSDKPLDFDPTLTPDQSKMLRLSTEGFGTVTFPAESVNRHLGLAWSW